MCSLSLNALDTLCSSRVIISICPSTIARTRPLAPRNSVKIFHHVYWDLSRSHRGTHLPNGRPWAEKSRQLAIPHIITYLRSTCDTRRHTGLGMCPLGQEMLLQQPSAHPQSDIGCSGGVQCC